MSYILDALRKSQREREPAPEAPPAAVHHISIALPSRSGWIIISGVVLLLALLVAFWFFWRGIPQETPASTVLPAVAPQPTAAAMTAAPPRALVTGRDLAEEARVAQPFASMPATRRKPETSAGTIVTPGAAVPAVVGSSDGIPLLQQMPLAFQRALPPLAVTIHVYAPDPSQRILFINNHEYHPGSEIAGGIRVEEIVPDGVVLRYQGERFKLSRPR
jgi:general secretion pathway protein B